MFGIDAVAVFWGAYAASVACSVCFSQYFGDL